MIKIYAIISFLICSLPTVTCQSYQLIGTEVLSEELVAQHYTINPNLDAVIVVDRTTPTFEYQTFYCAGSADEADGQQGRIHFLEHIISGTGSHEPGKLNQIVIENGGQKNAATSYHFSRFILRFPEDKIDLAVEIDRDRFYNTVISEEVVEKEKKIILTERSRIQSLQRTFANRFLGLVYGKKNFSILGTEDFIKQLEPVGLRAYYENFLRLQKRLIVVIGDVEVDQVLMKLDTAYGNTNDQKTRQFHPNHQFPKPEIIGKKFNIFSKDPKDLSISIFRKSWYTPNLGHRDYAGLLIIEYILNKPSNSLRSSVVNSKLANVFITGLDYYKGFSLMTCAANLPHDNSIGTIETMIYLELRKIKSISKNDLNVARNQQLKTMYSEFYDRSSLAYSLGQAFAHANDPLLYPKLIKDIKSIRREDIPRIIDQYLVDNNSITLSLTKKKWSIDTVIWGIALIIFPAVMVLFAMIGSIRKLIRKFSQN